MFYGEGDGDGGRHEVEEVNRGNANFEYDDGADGGDEVNRGVMTAMSHDNDDYDGVGAAAGDGGGVADYDDDDDDDDGADDGGRDGDAGDGNDHALVWLPQTAIDGELCNVNLEREQASDTQTEMQ
eukprot:6240252-Pyramimonas_sp.AAC.1